MFPIPNTNLYSVNRTTRQLKLTTTSTTEAERVCIQFNYCTTMSAINIYTLPSTERSTSSDAASIRTDIEKGLVGTSEPTVPGKKPEDRRWSFTKSVPTVVLYDEQGLR
jgi:hypothetical protein